MKTLVFGSILVISFIFKITFDEARADAYTGTNCKLTDGKVLRIACTTDCGWFNKRAIKSAAANLNYPIEIINIYNKSQEIQFDQFDAVIIPGGVDIDPKYYKKNIEQNIKDEIEKLDSLVNYSSEGVERDSFEYSFLKKYFDNNESTPILGICRGMQLLAVSQEIPLYVDIKKQLGFDNPMYTIDTVTVTKAESTISKIMHEKDFWGVQLHHQGLHLDYFNKYKDRWPNLEVTAVSNKGKIAEVLEFRDRSVLGVQFHPEYSPGTEKIFTWLLNQACKLKQ